MYPNQIALSYILVQMALFFQMTLFEYPVKYYALLLRNLQTFLHV